MAQLKSFYIRYWAPVFLWAMVIFFFSSLESSKTPSFDIWDFLIKKTAHFVEYAILAVLLVRAFRNSGFSFKKVVLYSILVAIFYAISDEFHQSFTPGRQPSVRDVIIDTLGAVGAVLAIWKLLPKAPTKLKSWAKRLEIV